MLVVLFTKVSSKMARQMAMESKKMLVEVFMRVSTKTTRGMVKESINGLMILNLKGSFSMTK